MTILYASLVGPYGREETVIPFDGVVKYHRGVVYRIITKQPIIFPPAEHGGEYQVEIYSDERCTDLIAIWNGSMQLGPNIFFKLTLMDES